MRPRSTRPRRAIWSQYIGDEACIARSTDGGKSFQPWQGMGFRGHPLQALRLPDYRVLLVYGYRYAPVGTRARILNAECTDFASSPEIVLRDDGGTTDLGYPWAVHLDERRVLVTYNFNVGSGIQHIAGTILEIDATPDPKPSASVAAPSVVDDDLTRKARQPAPLLIRTQLLDPANCGRGEQGWSVKGGFTDAYTRVTLRDLPTLGNRSQLAQLSFSSSQTDVEPGAHGLIEMTLCRGTTADDIPVRVLTESTLRARARRALRRKQTRLFRKRSHPGAARSLGPDGYHQVASVLP